MLVGFLVYDVLFVLAATLFYGGALAFGSAAYAELVAHRLPWSFALVLAGFSGVVALIAEVFAATLLCPRVAPGRYPMMKGAVFYGWLFRSLLRRILLGFGLQWVLFSSNVLRFLALRALGAKVAFTSSVSTDVALLDPALLVLQPKSMLGARCLVSGHFLDRGTLVLGEVHVGEGALLAVDVACAPGVRVGKGAIVKGRASLSVDVVVEDEADVGLCAVLEAKARVGRGARVAASATLAKGQVVEPGAAFP